MSSERRAWRVLALSLAITAACGGSDGADDPAPSVSAVEPACGDSSSTTPVVVRGSLPVKVVVSLSDADQNEVDAAYRAWVGDVELTEVRWTNAQELTARVPSGLPAGVYALTVEAPSGKRGTKDAAFEVRQGICPIATAALVIVSPLAAPATTVVGQQVTVTATVQNNGQAAASGVAASIYSAPAGLTPLSGPPEPQDVPGGQARTFTWTYTASAVGGGIFVVDAAGIAADTQLPAVAPRANTNAVLVNPGTFLSANTVVVPTEATVGQLITVALTATNQAASTVLVTPHIVVTGPVTPGSPPAAQSIPAGSARTFLWTYSTNAPGTATFTASVSGKDPGSGDEVTVPTAPVSVAVHSPPALSATLSIPTAIELGNFTVTMRVSNGGGPEAATAVDVVPDPPSVQAGSTASVVLVSGPTGSPATVVAGEPPVSFTWVFSAGGPGMLTLTSAARGKDANTGTPVASGTATSNTASVGLHSVGGTVAGLAGSGLVLHNGGDDLPIAADGPFTFPTRVGSGRPYAVTVAAQPTGPSQACTVTNGSGMVGSVDVTNVNVTCSTSTFTVGGTVTGLAGGGLVLRNGGESLPIGANGPYTFRTPVPSGGAYAVTVEAQPTGPSQTCTVTNGSGTVGAANVTNVSVICSTSEFTVGGTVTGLVGTGLVLRNDGRNLSITANGSYTFPTPIPSGGTYHVTVGVQPSDPSQTCTVTNAIGTVGSANVTDVDVTCSTRTFTVGGKISGLAGSGLVLHNRSDDLPIDANGDYTFPTPVPSGGTYDVTVAVQPTGPSQSCEVANARGTIGAADVTNVNVTCSTNDFTVGGTVTGLVGSGLVLRNGGENLSIFGDGAYTFSRAVPSGGSYGVTVEAQPRNPSQTCTVTNGSGTVGSANVTDVNVTCSTPEFTVGGTITGLVGDGLVLQNGSDTLNVSAGVTGFVFPTPVPRGGAYAVAVTAQPTNQFCDVANGSGTVWDANVTGVLVSCTP